MHTNYTVAAILKIWKIYLKTDFMERQDKELFQML